MKIKTILLPVDFSCYDRVAMEYATGLARQHGAAIQVVHAVEPLSAYAGAAYWGEALEDEKQRYQRLQAIRATAPDVPVQHVMLRADTTGLTTDGDVANELVEYAKQTSCDLIVMSSRGRTGLVEKLFGGVTEQVLRHAPCPVLIVNASCPSEE